MLKFLSKPRRWAAVYSLFLIGALTLVLLDTFVIPQSQTAVSARASQEAAASGLEPGNAVITDSSYKDDNIQISVETVQEYGTTVYIADVQVADASLLRTALADDTFGRNIKETTSEIAGANNAILAINGDYYGFRNNGYVVRNGILYRDSARSGSDAEDSEDLVVDNEGDFTVISENQTGMSTLNTDDIWQLFSFGPALVVNGQVAVDAGSEVSQSMSSNPRTAIGQAGPRHYVFVVADGRTSASTGLSLLQLAEIVADRGCTTAYNLDGGGSSTMYFNGKIVNQPTDGRNQGEREVSDIVYIGY